MVDQCKAHGKRVCTLCNPVEWVTRLDDPCISFYMAYYQATGRESALNHKEVRMLSQTIGWANMIPVDLELKVIPG